MSKTGMGMRESHRATLRRAFDLVDRDGDGYLGTDELALFLKGANSLEVHDVLFEVDENGDGKVCACPC